MRFIFLGTYHDKTKESIDPGRTEIQKTIYRPTPKNNFYN